jgi:hypothetical protein
MTVQCAVTPTNYPTKSMTVKLVLSLSVTATNSLSELPHTPFSLPISDILCQNFQMSKLTATLCLTLAVLLGSVGSLDGD